MPKHIFKIATDLASKDIAGLVKLSDEIDSNLNVDNSTASTPYATKQAYDKALESANAVSEVNETITALNKKVSSMSSTVIVYTDGGIFPVDTYKNVVMELQADSKFTLDKAPSLYFEFNIYLTNGGNYNVVFAGNVKWSNNITPTLSKDATDILKFITVDFGTTWYGIVLGSNL